MTLAQEIEQIHADSVADGMWDVEGVFPIYIAALVSGVFGTADRLIDTRIALLDIAGSIAAKAECIAQWKEYTHRQLKTAGWEKVSFVEQLLILAGTIYKIYEHRDQDRKEYYIGVALAEIEHIQSLQK